MLNYNDKICNGPTMHKSHNDHDNATKLTLSLFLALFQFLKYIPTRTQHLWDRLLCNQAFKLTDIFIFPIKRKSEILIGTFYKHVFICYDSISADHLIKKYRSEGLSDICVHLLRNTSSLYFSASPS